MVVWDSHVKDGFKRSRVPAADGSGSGDAPTPVGWDGKKTSGVVEELLRNSSDKAYGASGETRTHTHVTWIISLTICSRNMFLYVFYSCCFCLL